MLSWFGLPRSREVGMLPRRVKRASEHTPFCLCIQVPNNSSVYGGHNLVYKVWISVDSPAWEPHTDARAQTASAKQQQHCEHKASVSPGKRATVWMAAQI